jgi:predicted nucleic acid-binding protein
VVGPSQDLPYLDTNVIIRHLTRDNPAQSPRAAEIFARIERGELRVLLVETVIFETVFTLWRSYRQTKAGVRDAILALLDLPGMVMAQKERVRRALDFFVDLNISFGDAYLVAIMEQEQASQIISFDRDFDRVPGIERFQP